MTLRNARFVRCLAPLALALALPLAPSLAQPVVQALPDPAAADLGDALQRLARDPQSLPALIAAGRASLQLTDYEAARGFFTRAEAIAPADGRVLAGLALVELKEKKPVAALRLFDRAEQAGEPMGPYAADRGLAYDLAGDNARAQQLYTNTLTQSREPEVIRRLALSQAIAGDHAASEATLLPLLQASDLAAFRTRAFALAISGQGEEAETIAVTMLPARMAQRLSPYLQYMPRLTRAQQAAAANLGEFPRSGQIGRDEPEIAAYASGTAPASTAPSQAQADARLIPGGAPLGSQQTPAELPAVESQAVSPPIDPPAAVASLEKAPAEASPAVATSENAPPEPAPPVATSENAPPETAPTVATLGNPPPKPTSTMASLENPPPEPAPAVAAPRISLDEAFADLQLPSDVTPARPAAGAVDITRITPARQAPPPAPRPEPAPRRHWVQVATGQDAGAFGFDWRRITRNAGGLLDGRDAFYSAWGSANRLLTGPFASEDEAQAFVTRLAGAGVESFRYTSPTGEEVVPIP